MRTRDACAIGIYTSFPAPAERNVYRGARALLLAPAERQLAGADAAPPELEALFEPGSINIPLRRS